MTDSKSELENLPKEWRDFAGEISNNDFTLSKIFGVDNNEKLDEDEYYVFFAHEDSCKYFVFIKAFEFYDTTKNLGVDTIKPSYIDKGYFPIMDNKNSILKIRMNKEYQKSNTTGLGSWSMGKDSMQNQGRVKKVDGDGKITFCTEDIEVVVSKSGSFYKTFDDMINGNTEKELVELAQSVREHGTKDKDEDYKDEVKKWIDSSKEGNEYKSSEHRLSDDTYEAVKELVNSNGNNEECENFKKKVQKEFEGRLQKLKDERTRKLIKLYQEITKQKETEIKDKKETWKKAEIVKLEGESKTEDNKESEIQELKEKLAKLQKELEEKNKELEEKNEEVKRLSSENEDLKGIGRQNVVDKMDKFLFGEQKIDRPEDAKKFVLESKKKSKEEVSKFSEDIKTIIEKNVSKDPQTTDQIIASCYNEVMTNRKINTEPWQVIKKDGFFVFKKGEESEFAVIGNDLCEVLPILTHFKCLPLEEQKLPYETNAVKICSVEEVVNVRAPISSEKTKGSSGTGITRY